MTRQTENQTEGETRPTKRLDRIKTRHTDRQDRHTDRRDRQAEGQDRQTDRLGTPTDQTERHTT